MTALTFTIKENKKVKNKVYGKRRAHHIREQRVCDTALLIKIFSPENFL